MLVAYVDLLWPAVWHRAILIMRCGGVSACAACSNLVRSIPSYLPPSFAYLPVTFLHIPVVSSCALQYILKREVAKFEVDHILKGTALGELDHPNYASRYFKCLNLPNISHQVGRRVIL